MSMHQNWSESGVNHQKWPVISGIWWLIPPWISLVWVFAEEQWLRKGSPTYQHSQRRQRLHIGRRWNRYSEVAFRGGSKLSKANKLLKRVHGNAKYGTYKQNHTKSMHIHQFLSTIVHGYPRSTLTQSTSTKHTNTTRVFFDFQGLYQPQSCPCFPRGLWSTTHYKCVDMMIWSHVYIKYICVRV